MKKELIFSAVLLFANGKMVLAQDADLDKYYFKTQAVRLPNVYFPENQRTFFVSLEKNATGINYDFSKVTINGFTNVGTKTDGALEIVVNLPVGLKSSGSQMDTKTSENKDKDGNVTKTYFYKVVESYSTMGNSASIKDIDKSRTHLAFNQSYETKVYNKSADAVSDYNLRKNEWYSDFKSKVERDTYFQLNYFYNIFMGYPVSKNTVKLWLIGSKKNPDFQSHQDALKIMQDVFATVTYDKLPENIKQNLQPAITIFENTITKYPDDNRKHRKLRYSGYYNLMKIYYNIDDFDKATEYANLLITNNYDSKDGKDMLELINKRKKDMETVHVTSLHFPIPNYDQYSLEYNN